MTKPFVSATCEGETCWCGKPAIRKVGEEIPIDDPMPHRHNLTVYICAEHYSQLMGPRGARHVGVERALNGGAGVDPGTKALREALETFVGYGCPACNGDCASANPPVPSCPMQEAREALEKTKP
jgi:hypothetical protein